MRDSAMRHSVRPKAAADIRRIYEQGAEMFGVAQAERYAAGLELIFEFLAENSYAARLRSELEPRFASIGSSLT